MEIPDEYRISFENYSEKLRKNPQSLSALLQLSWIYQVSKAPEKQFEMLQKAVEIIDNSEELRRQWEDIEAAPENPYYWMASYYEEKNWNEALCYYLKALALEQVHEEKLNEAAVPEQDRDDTLGQIFTHLGDCCCELEDYSKALEWYLKSDAYYQTSSTIRHIGWAYYKLKDYKKAIDYLLKAIDKCGPLSKYTQGSLCCYYTDLGMIYKGAKQDDEAVAAFQQASEIDPSAWE